MAPSMAEEEFECEVVVKNTFLAVVPAHGLTRQSSCPAKLLTCDHSIKLPEGRSRSTTVDSLTDSIEITKSATVPTTKSAPVRHKSLPDVCRALGSRFAELDIDSPKSLQNSDIGFDVRDDGCIAHSETSETCEEPNDLVSEDEESKDSNLAEPTPQKAEEAGESTKRAEETHDMDNTDRELEEAQSIISIQPAGKTARRNQRRKKLQRLANEEEQRINEKDCLAKKGEDANGSEKSPKSKKKNNKKVAVLSTSTEIDDSQISPHGSASSPTSKKKKKNKSALLESPTEVDDSQTLPTGCAQVQGKETCKGGAATKASVPNHKTKSAAHSLPANLYWQGANPTAAERVQLKQEFMQVCRKQFNDVQVLESNFHSVMTPEQLAKFNCNCKRPLVSIHGDIYDVSKNPDVYGPGGLLCFEAGFDITWAVVSNSRNTQSCNIFCDIYKATDENQLTTWFLRLCNAILTFQRDYGKPIARLSVFREERELAPPPSSVLTEEIAECTVQ